MTIKDMIEKRAKVWETAKNFVDTHTFALFSIISLIVIGFILP